MEPKPSLIGTNSAVELDSVADIDMDLALVVNPRHPESDDSLRLNDPFDDFSFFKLRVLIVNILHGYEHLVYSLQILLFTRVFALQVLHNFLNFHSGFILDLRQVKFSIHLFTAKIYDFYGLCKAKSEKKEKNGVNRRFFRNEVRIVNSQ